MLVSHSYHNKMKVVINPSETVSLGATFLLSESLVQEVLPRKWVVHWEPNNIEAFTIVREIHDKVKDDTPGAPHHVYFDLKTHRIGDWEVIADLVATTPDGTVFERQVFPINVPMMCLPDMATISLLEEKEATFDSSSDDDDCCIIS